MLNIDVVIPALSLEVVKLTSNGNPTEKLPEMAAHIVTVPLFSKTFICSIFQGHSYICGNSGNITVTLLRHLHSICTTIMALSVI